MIILFYMDNFKKAKGFLYIEVHKKQKYYNQPKANGMCWVQ